MVSSFMISNSGSVTKNIFIFVATFIKISLMLHTLGDNLEPLDSALKKEYTHS